MYLEALVERPQFLTQLGSQVLQAWAVTLVDFLCLALDPLYRIHLVSNGVVYRLRHDLLGASGVLVNLTSQIGVAELRYVLTDYLRQPTRAQLLHGVEFYRTGIGCRWVAFRLLFGHDDRLYTDIVVGTVALDPELHLARHLLGHVPACGAIVGDV
jgi:hypothetical protein